MSGDIIYRELQKALTKQSKLEAEVQLWRDRAAFAVGAASYWAHTPAQTALNHIAFSANLRRQFEEEFTTDPEPDPDNEKAHRDWRSHNECDTDPREDR